jgi:hypothetical protein
MKKFNKNQQNHIDSVSVDTWYQLSQAVLNNSISPLKIKKHLLRELRALKVLADMENQ